MQIISGIFKNRILNAPKGQVTRPTSSRLREALFNICQHYTEGARFLDLFAGSGAMGLEALSRGASFATFIDNNRESQRAIRKNIELLDVESQTEFFFADVFQQLKKLSSGGQSFDLIYADPPYEAMIKDRAGQSLFFSALVMKFIDESNLLAPGGALFIEDADTTHLPQDGWMTLKLQSIRKMGRSTLYHFQKN